MIEQHTILGCRRGDRRSQLELYQALAPRLYSTCLRIVGSTAEAEEAMQDAILKLLRLLAKEGSGEGADSLHKPLEAIATRIAVNSAIDRLRRHHLATVELIEGLDYAESSTSDDSSENIEESLEGNPDAARIAQVKAALAELAPGYRTILSLHLFEGYDFEEISEILRLQPASVRSQYLRAKQRLLEKLNR